MPLDFESVGAAGSMLGTRALQIFDETTCVVRAVDALDRVLRARVLRQVHPVPRGHLLAGADPRAGSSTARAREEDLDKLLDICDNILGASFCALGDGATQPDHLGASSTSARSTSAHLTGGGCPFDPAASTLFAKDDVPA